MQTLQWLQIQMPFLQAEWFSVAYGLVVFLNPFAMVPQLFSAVRAKPEELRGVSVAMFILFFVIQIAVALGAIKNVDTALFVSMLISAIITFTVIAVTTLKRSSRYKLFSKGDGMNCIEQDCKGEIDVAMDVSIQVGCRAWDVAFPCNICGRLHFLTGNEVTKIPVGVDSRGGDQKAFLVDGEVVRR